MKKTIIFFFFSIMALSSYAQSKTGGYRVGLNLAQWNGSANGSSSTSDTRTGFLLGFYLTYMINDKVGIQPEFLYNSNGAVISPYTFKTSYLSVPVFFRYNANEHIHLLAGPQVGILLSADASGQGGSGSFKSITNSTDFSLVFGMGVDLNKFNLGVRYNAGLTNVFQDSAFSSFGSGAKITNVGWQIVCGIRAFGD